MVASQDVVDVVDSSRSESDLGEVRGPDTSIHVLGMILGEIVGVDVIMDITSSLIPFLVVVLLKMMVAWTNRENVQHFLKVRNSLQLIQSVCNPCRERHRTFWP